MTPMMPEQNVRIHLLDSYTANQIAAGEVVERPASIVKELVENAIDAGATRIEVRISNQDCTKIQITDNGCGMTKEELPLAILRHATSKISRVDDLEKLHTLGFRGEALPSIAAVSRLTILSKVQDADVAYQIEVKDGTATTPVEAAYNTGTCITVEDLFYNVPARKKFLKSPRTEMSVISDIMSNFIVAYPSVAFTLRHGNHRAVVSYGTGDRLKAIEAAFGKDIAMNLLRLPDDGVVSGFISRADYYRSNRSHYHFFINDRCVTCRDLYPAVDEGFSTYLPGQKFPVLFLFLNLAPQDVDVNVHPSKSEVKIKDLAAVRSSVASAIQQAYRDRSQQAPSVLSIPDEYKVDALPVLGRDTKPTHYPTRTAEHFDYGEERTAMRQEDLYALLHRGTVEKPSAPIFPVGQNNSSTPAVAPKEEEAEQEQFWANYLAEKKFYYSDLHLIGQFLGTYILASKDNTLYVVDQHAAVERIIYEELLETYEDKPADSMQLAIPTNIQLSYEEHLLVTEHILALRDFGFILEYFGDTTYVIRAIPVWYEEGDAATLLFALMEHLKEGQNDPLMLRKAEMFKAACKAAVKANRYLSQQEMNHIFVALDKISDNLTCPHGRPIAITFSEAELRKRFLRSSISR